MLILKPIVQRICQIFTFCRMALVYTMSLEKINDEIAVFARLTTCAMQQDHFADHCKWVNAELQQIKGKTLEQWNDVGQSLRKHAIASLHLHKHRIDLLRDVDSSVAQHKSMGLNAWIFGIPCLQALDPAQACYIVAKLSADLNAERKSTVIAEYAEQRRDVFGTQDELAGLLCRYSDCFQIWVRSHGYRNGNFLSSMWQAHMQLMIVPCPSEFARLARAYSEAGAEALRVLSGTPTAGKVLRGVAERVRLDESEPLRACVRIWELMQPQIKYQLKHYCLEKGYTPRVYFAAEQCVRCWQANSSDYEGRRLDSGGWSCQSCITNLTACSDAET